MSPKKSKRSQAAEQLIENLLDEKPSPSKPSHEQNEIVMLGETGSFGPVEKDEREAEEHLVIDDQEPNEASLHLEVSQKIAIDPVLSANKKAPFDGDAPVVTKMVQRSKVVRPSEPKPLEDRSRDRAPDVDFGEMSAEDPFLGKEAVHLPSEPVVPPPQQEEENTVRVRAQTLVSDPEPRSEVIPISRSIDRGGATEIRSGIKVPPSPRVTPASGAGTPYSSIETTLKQSESLRIAQSRITELERELERVRRDNESLSTAGDTLRRRADELAGKAESLEGQAREALLRLDEEKKVLRGQIQGKDRENAEMKARVEEIETRLESNFKKIRVRERELEHRLEITKMENATLVSTKDKMLLDLKRQIDQLHQESESAKNKSQELFSQYKEKQETIRRVVRALRIALTILEGDDEGVVPLKKAE